MEKQQTIAQAPTRRKSSSTMLREPMQTQAKRTSIATIRDPLSTSLQPQPQLPPPPPDPRENPNDNIFKYPPIKDDLPAAYRCLLECSQRDEAFFQMLNAAIENDCQQLRAQASENICKPPIDSENFTARTPSIKTRASQDFTASQIHKCPCCEELREECEQYIHPLQMRFKSSASAALAAYGAVDQLNRLYSMWDQYLDVEKKWRQRRECLKYVNLLEQKTNTIFQKIRTAPEIKREKPHLSDTEAELEQSAALLESILSTSESATTKRNAFKQPRERSKSVIVEDMSGMQKNFDPKSTSPGPYLLRRQSTYSDGKSKVSKWTKVKAAFKWERANVPALAECSKDLQNGLQPINHEVARYLRVPSIPGGGGSSADSILSSSSGHLLSEAGTPGTISSASSMDDIIDGSNRSASRRNSSKSDTRCDSRVTDIMELSPTISTTTTQPRTNDFYKLTEHHHEDAENQKSTKSLIAQSKSGSIKSLRRGKTVTDFEVVPEDVVAEISSGSTRKSRMPPSPLNLNLKQDITDSDGLYSPYFSKSPKDGTQSLNRTKKVHSPGNSSVPSSPSRHSDFFAEFESEELSSGDFSEPSSPNHLSSRRTFHQKQDEINQRYKVLRAKLDAEFETKRREWEKIKNNPNNCRAINLITSTKSEELSPNQTSCTPNVATKLLEENLTPDFKKKLNKWRVKKQISHSSSSISQQQQQQQLQQQLHQQLQLQQQQLAQLPAPASPNKDVVCFDSKGKIDWNLWRTGQIKLEGQGLCALPDQKDLPEEFQKKLEQWNKIKRCGGSRGGGGDSGASGNDSIKRNSKSGAKNKGSDDDRCYWDRDKRDKHKGHDKDKSEKFAKLKAIVAEHPAKEIEVKTSAGVMKFEGISRKFTRKLYEWEKSRGIGPESSTFALLHPGYCPIDVGRIKESNNNENSPTLSRSLSLDSVAPNIGLPVISHQASSLSLNDVNDLKEVADGCCSDTLAEVEYKRYEEPEAVMVEVEDHIVETASPLVTATSFVEQQTPVYKYEEMACNDYCNTRRVQSFESPTNVAPLLTMLKRTDELFASIKNASTDIASTKALQLCEASLLLIRNVYTYFTENLMKPNVLNAISDVQIELSRLAELHKKSPLNEACCTEIMDERNNEYEQELRGLYDSLEFLRESIQGGQNRYPSEFVPFINITSEDGLDSSVYVTCDSASKEQNYATVETTDEFSCSHMENDTESTTSTTLRSNLVKNNSTNKNNNNSSNNNCINDNDNDTTINSSNSGLNNYNNNNNSNNNNNNSNGNNSNNNINNTNSNNGNNNTPSSTNSSIGKKKLRLRKMGSRQSSKTESDSSADDVQNALVETPRRLKRKNFRLKQRSLDEDFRRSEEHTGGSAAAGIDTIAENVVYVLRVVPGQPIEQSEKIIEPTEDRSAYALPTTIENSQISRASSNPNVFVKTKRKLFTAVQEPTAAEGVALMVKDIETTTSSDDTKAQSSTANTRKPSEDVKSQKEAQPKPAPEQTSKRPPPPFRRKALSMSNLSAHGFEDERKSQSTDSIKPLELKYIKEVRPPLATDSFRVINKNLSKDHPFVHHSGVVNKVRHEVGVKRKEHIFKKNTEKLNKSVSASIKKIENKIAKTNSGSSVDQAAPELPSATHDKNGNTLPRICRKLERKSLTPTTKQNQFDYSTLPQPTKSEPTTPHYDNKNKPHTPLSERAQRLAKAKEQFLQGTAGRGEPNVKLREDLVRNENWEQYRRSDQSAISSVLDDDGQLLKSMSTDTITANTTTASEAGTDIEAVMYDDSARAVTRSSKFSSKLGFATFASKFRRVKVKKPKEAGVGSTTSALSALCKQSLLADVIAAPQILGSSTANAAKSNENLMKSLSTPDAVSSAAASTQAAKRHEADRLNKSQSEQIVVKSQKESFV